MLEAFKANVNRIGILPFLRLLFMLCVCFAYTYICVPSSSASSPPLQLGALKLHSDTLGTELSLSLSPNTSPLPLENYQETTRALPGDIGYI